MGLLRELLVEVADFLVAELLLVDFLQLAVRLLGVAAVSRGGGLLPLVHESACGARVLVGKDGKAALAGGDGVQVGHGALAVPHQVELPIVRYESVAEGIPSMVKDNAVAFSGCRAQCAASHLEIQSARISWAGEDHT